MGLVYDFYGGCCVGVVVVNCVLAGAAAGSAEDYEALEALGEVVYYFGLEVLDVVLPVE